MSATLQGFNSLKAFCPEQGVALQSAKQVGVIVGLLGNSRPQQHSNCTWGHQRVCLCRSRTASANPQQSASTALPPPHVHTDAVPGAVVQGIKVAPRCCLSAIHKWPRSCVQPAQCATVWRIPPSTTVRKSKPRGRNARAKSALNLRSPTKARENYSTSMSGRSGTAPPSWPLP